MSQEIEETLAKEELELKRDTEIERILQAFKLDGYSILELVPGCAQKEITKQFRRKSLLIHPDKTRNPRAPDAFDVLKKAHKQLENEKERAELDAVFSDARRLLAREKNWKLDDARLQGEVFLKEWRAKISELLIEEEFAKRMALKRQLQEEGELKRKREEELEAKQLQRKAAKKWEDQRDERVQNWRSYLGSKKKKKKAKVIV